MARSGDFFAPFLIKELRGTSRRMRHYVLRFLCVCALTLYVTAVWMNLVSWGSTAGGSIYQVSRMGDAGKQIIAWLVWFQFFGAQVIAIVVMSTSISGEVYRRTLGVLMTTPLTGMQIILGKLLGGMCQLLLVLGISLPAMAMVQVLGGVPWEFVLAGFGISLTACLFAGAVTVFYSIVLRKTFAIIAVSAMTVIGIHAVLSFLTLPGAFISRSALLGSPEVALGALTVEMLSPGSGGVSMWLWWVNSLIMLGLSALCVLLCAKQVRKLALRQVCGDIGAAVVVTYPYRPALIVAPARPVAAPVAAVAAPSVPTPAAAPPPLPQARGRDITAGGPLWPPPLPPPTADTPIRRVSDCPLVWKAQCGPRLRDRPLSVAGIVVVGWVLFVAYLSVGAAGALDSKAGQAFFMVTFVIVGMLATFAMSAATIASEKESQCWPLLLTTTLTDWGILRDKLRWVWRRTRLIWAGMGAHLLLFLLLGFIHPILAVHMLLIAGWAALFSAGLGVFCSTLLGRTTSAVVACFGVALALWLILPLLMVLIGELSGSSGFVEVPVSLNPVVQTVIATAGGTYGDDRNRDDWSADPYEWPTGNTDAAEATGMILLSALLYGGSGALLAYMAMRRFRKHVF